MPFAPSSFFAPSSMFLDDGLILLCSVSWSLRLPPYPTYFMTTPDVSTVLDRDIKHVFVYF